MGEGLLSDSGSGTAIEAPEQTVVPAQSNETVGQMIGGNSESVPDQQVTQEDPYEKAHALEIALQKEKAEKARLAEYNQFLKDAVNFKKPSGDDPYKNVRELDAEAVPFVGDVKQLIELGVAEKLMELEEQRSLNELAQYGQQMRSSDPSFDNRMNLAFEVIATNPEFFEPFVQKEKTAAGKVAVLERIAKQHPNFEYTPTVPQPAQPAQAIVNKIKNNLSIPPTLATMQGSGVTQKAIKDMTLQEYLEFKESIKKQL